MAFPASVVEMLRGDLGQPPGGWPKALQAKVLKGEQADHGAARLAAAGRRSRRARRRRRRGKIGRPLERATSLLSYLMYPKVFTDYAAMPRKYGPVSVLPTPVFFYGMKPGEEIAIEIERGKALVIRAADHRRDRRGRPGPGLLRAQRPAPHHQGAQPRAPRPRVEARRKAEEGNDSPCRRAHAGRRSPPSR